MDISIKKAAIGAVVLLVAGLAIGRFTLPAKVVTKIETKTEIKEVVKWKTKYLKEENKNKETIIIETKYPDGTTKKETRIVDKGTIKIDLTKEGDKKKDTDTNTKEETTTTYAKNDWHISLLGAPSDNSSPLSPNFTYGLMIQRRIIGPFYLGGFGIKNKSYGLSIGALF